MTTIIISVLSLCTSLAVLVVHYRNQLERRHGEIVKLRTDFLKSLSSTRHRSVSAQLHLETARLELRRMQENDDKYQYIEMMPRLIEKSKLAHERLEQRISMFEDINPTKSNKSKMLITLQSMSHDVQTVEDLFMELEQEILQLLEDIRAEQEKN